MRCQIDIEETLKDGEFQQQIENLQTKLQIQIQENKEANNTIEILQKNLDTLNKNIILLYNKNDILSTENCLLKKENEILHQTNKTSFFSNDSTEAGFSTKQNEAIVSISENTTTQTDAVVCMTGEEMEVVAKEGFEEGGYIFDESVGMYYDQVSRCYYDADNSMFYHAETGAYYSYDHNTMEYSYHSTADSSHVKLFNHLLDKKTKNKSLEKKQKQQKLVTSVVNNNEDNDDDAVKKDGDDDDVLEDGELVSDDGDDGDDDGDEDDGGDDIKTTNNHEVNGTNNHCISQQELLERYIPCVRMVVKNSKCLKVNSLFIVTCKFAGVIGREGGGGGVDVNFICIKDPFVSKRHCSIVWEEQRYFVVDLDSTHGVYVNQVKVNQRQQLRHNDHLSVCQHLFQLHIHPQSDTCNYCEPGQLGLGIEAGVVDDVDDGDGVNPNKDSATNKDISRCDESYGDVTMWDVTKGDVTKGGGDDDKNGAKREVKLVHKLNDNEFTKDKNILEEMRRLELKKIKKKYALQKPNVAVCVSKPASKSGVVYKDRALHRRMVVGSEAYKYDEEEDDEGGDDDDGVKDKTSLDAHLPSTNTGFRLLKKMGWKEGEGLGKNACGITLPVQTIKRSDKTGLGCEDFRSKNKNSGKTSKSQRWMETKKRYDDIK